ncbi:DUF554 domain-containing protein [Alicyclobacillus mengziensis]|uniref:DUF554 domain-containing protein n=1 Tax=Alicyclobacillus mengziensis TaxID=2931921 RepID=A0A9X7Z7Y5_9BACL|nr:DUF554 domain-containing protein [Alicyclobacillus mengziensis]QSO47718.1 DUF554 domain-containing protein [Alicyclobacillus mengziensis]
MYLLGTIVNGVAVLLGTSLGLLLPKVPPRFHTTVMQGLALTVVLIGLSMALSDSSDLLIIIISMVVGGLIGEWINIDHWLTRMGDWVQSKVSQSDTSKIAEGFVTASLVFCVGSMSIVGAIQSGLADMNRTLYAKSLLDFVSSTVFASTLGIGVLFSFIPVVVYEGGIATLAHAFGGQLQNQPVIAAMTAAGGLLIAAIGMNILGFKKLSVGNLLPAMFVAAGLKWLAPHITTLFSFFHG